MLHIMKFHKKCIKTKKKTVKYCADTQLKKHVNVHKKTSTGVE